MIKNAKALKFVQRQFPNVEKVVDATSGIRVTVTKRDSTGGRKKDPRDCAMARACVRELKADGAIINVSTAYVVKGNVATRYTTSEAVAREITSFDRHQDFAEGNDYLLSRIAPAKRFGYKRDHGASTRAHSDKLREPVSVHHHKTADIRVSARGK